MTNEVEALETKAKEAYERDGATWAQVVESVARAVRSQDAARAGTLSEEELDDRLTIIANAGHSAKVEKLREHMAAQGRANAALEDGKAALQRSFDATYGDWMRTTRERDEARAELAKAQAVLDAAGVPTDADEREKGRTGTLSERVDMLATARRRWMEQFRASESALATLRRAVEPLVEEVSGTRQKSESSSLFLARDDEPGPEVLSAERLDALIAAYDATPAEHPDTATLRKVRERARDADAMLKAYFSGIPTPFDVGDVNVDGLRALAAYLLGDSGPSGGGEHRDCGACGGPLPSHRDAVCESCTPESQAHAVAVSMAPTTPQDEPETCDDCGAIIGGNPDCAACFEWVRKDAEKPTTPPDVPTSEPTPEKDWGTVDAFVAPITAFSPDAIRRVEALRAALARLKAEPRRAADSHGVVRPVLNCGHVNAADGLCTHPSNLTPECHKAACPMLPEKVARRAAEAMRERCAVHVENWVGPNNTDLALMLRALPL